MSSELLIDRVRKDFEAIINAIQSDLPESRTDVGGFFYNVMRAREKIHGAFDPEDKLGEMREGHEHDKAVGLVVGGWLVAHTRSYDRDDAPWFRYPRPVDVRLAARLFGLNVRKVVTWLELDQTEIFHSQMHRNLHVTAGGGDIDLTDIPRIQRALLVLGRTRDGFRTPLVVPDLKTLATIGTLSDEEILALSWNKYSTRPTEAPHDPEIPTWVPDLVSLTQCRATPPDRMFYWKRRVDMSVDERERLHARFPGPSQKSSDMLKLKIALARGKSVSNLLPMLTAKEAHEFLYSTEWHDDPANLRNPDDPYGFLVRKLDLLEFRRARLRPGHFKVLRWLRHLLDTGKRESLNKDRRFVDAYNLPYSSYYYARLDEVRDEDIVNVSDGLSTVFARVDDRHRRDVNLTDEDLDNPLCTMPDLGNYLPEGWKFLTTRRELIGEGKRLKHCVAGYHKSVSEGNCFILSICDDDGMSTAELMGMNYGRGTSNFAPYQIVQFKSVRNSDPPRNHVNKFTRLRWAYEVMCTFKSELEEKDPKAIWVNPCKALIVRVLSDPTNPRTTQLYETKALPIINQSHWPIGMAHWLLCEMFEHHRAAIDEIMSAFQADWPSKGVTP